MKFVIVRGAAGDWFYATLKDVRGLIAWRAAMLFT